MSSVDDNRRSWLDLIRQWRREGAIDDRDQGALERHYDERQAHVRQALAAIAPEYERRVREDGQAHADDWLRETARAMGREDGESTRRMLESVSR